VLVGVLVAVVVAEVGARAAAGRLPEPQRWSTPEAQYKVEQMAGRRGVEVAVVGSSVVDVSIDPTRLPRPAYNASLGAGTIRMVRTFALDVAVPMLDPDVVVVGVSSRELNGNARGQRELEDEFFRAPALRRRTGTESMADVVERVAGEVSYVVRYRSVLRDPGRWIDPQPSWDERSTRHDGLYLGFLDAAYRATPEVLARTRGDALHRFTVGRQELAAFRSLVQRLAADGRRVVVVVPPVSADYVRAYPRGAADHQRFLDAVAAVAGPAGAPLVVAGVWDDSLMADPLHTNREGTARFSDLVAPHVAP